MVDFSFDDLDDILDNLNDQLAGLDDEEAEPQMRPRKESHRIEIKPAAVEDFEDLDGLLDDLSAIKKSKNVTQAISAGAVSTAPKPPPSFAQPQIPIPAPTSTPMKREEPKKEEPKKEDDILASLSRATDDLKSLDPREVQRQKELKIQEAMQRLKEANIKKMQVRIYIEDDRMFKTVNITSLMETEAVIKDVLEKAHLDPDPTWTLFECVYDYGVERPLKFYEKVTDVMYTWEMETTNGIMLKKFPQKSQLNIVQIADEFPRMSGVMYFEVKKKWIKRYFELKLSGIYHFKDTKLSQETFLCNWFEYDIYEVIASRKKAPSKFSFSLKYQDKISKLSDPENAAFYFCVENEDVLNRWAAAFRNAKNRKFLEDHPEYAQGRSLKVSAETSVFKSLQSVGAPPKHHEEKDKAEEKPVTSPPVPNKERPMSPPVPNKERPMSPPVPSRERPMSPPVPSRERPMSPPVVQTQQPPQLPPKIAPVSSPPSNTNSVYSSTYPVAAPSWSNPAPTPSYNNATPSYNNPYNVAPTTAQNTITPSWSNPAPTSSSNPPTSTASYYNSTPSNNYSSNPTPTSSYNTNTNSAYSSTYPVAAPSWSNPAPSSYQTETPEQPLAPVVPRGAAMGGINMFGGFQPNAAALRPTSMQQPDDDQTPAFRLPPKPSTPAVTPPQVALRSKTPPPAEVLPPVNLPPQPALRSKIPTQNDAPTYVPTSSLPPVPSAANKPNLANNYASPMLPLTLADQPPAIPKATKPQFNPVGETLPPPIPKATKPQIGGAEIPPHPVGGPPQIPTATKPRMPDQELPEPPRPNAASKPKMGGVGGAGGVADDELQARMRRIAARNMTE